MLLKIPPLFVPAYIEIIDLPRRKQSHRDWLVGRGSQVLASAFCAPPQVGDGFDFGDLLRGVARGPDQRNIDLAITKRAVVSQVDGEFRD